MMSVKKVVRTAFFLTVFLIMTFIISSSVIIVGKFTKGDRLVRLLELIWAKSAVWASGMKLKTHIPPLCRHQNYIFLSNHQSYLDIPVLLTVFSKFFPRFFAKRSLFDIFLFGPGMRRCGHFPVDRENKRQGLKDLQYMIDKVKKGESALVFPEGTRSPDINKLLDFQIGAFIAIIRTKVPVVPVLIYGTGKVLPRDSFWVTPSVVKVVALPPMRFDDYSIKEREELRDYLKQIMEKKFLEIKECNRPKDQKNI